MSDNIIEAKELCYSYPDGTNALKNVNIKIRKGITTAILGGNGAGKSTLFLNCNGILKPESGEVLHNDKPVDYSRTGMKNLRKSVGIVFQDPDNQLFSASVYQDISFGAVNLGLPEEEVRRRVEDAMDRTGITELRDKPTHNLSYGQKKRAAIAGVLVMEPELLILDEPTAGLDPIGVGEVMKLLREMQESMSISLVISTHDIDIVPLYCDYAYVLDKGEVVLEGTPTEIFSEPEKLRSINLRLPRIAHLMEILKKRDDFVFDEDAMTISEARKVLNEWRESNCRPKGE